MDPNNVVQSAYSVLNRWTSAQDKTFDRFMGLMTQEDRHEHWQLSKTNRIKINIDAAIFEESNCYGDAFVVCNQSGEFMEAGSKCSRGTINAELAEAKGIREALSWVKQKQVEGAEVETDCPQVVQAIRSSVSSFTYLGRVVECRKLLASLKDQDILFRFFKRSANSVAHYLARYSCSVTDRRVAVDGGWKMFTQLFILFC